MRSKYWIKLYHEILTDPKMGRLPDSEWRRCIELFLLAGQINEGGQLPETDDISWYLHIDTEQLQAELDHLQEVGIVQKNDDGWYITQFAKRQAPVSDAERQQRYRMRKGIDEIDSKEPKEITQPSQDDNDIVTNGVTNGNIVTNRNADIQITDTDKELPKGSDKKPKKRRQPPTPAFKVFSGITGYHKITRYWRNKMADAVGDERECLELWAKVIKGWTGKGWFEGNIEGMLEFYQRGEIPGDRTNGQHQATNRGRSDRSQRQPEVSDPAAIRADIERAKRDKQARSPT
jgi:hypothetical protein